MKKLFYLCFAILIACHSLSAQVMNWKNYANCNTIIRMLNTPDYLWLATDGGCHTIGSIICNYLYCYDCKTYYPSGEECDCKKDIYFCVTCENYLYSTGEFFSHRSRYPLHKIVSQFLYCNDCSAIEYLSEEWIKHENHNYVIKNLGE